MLWLLRRPALKRLRHWTPNLAPIAMRERVRLRMIRQDRFARRYGLPALTLAINLFLASVALTLTFSLALSLLDSGALSVPDAVRDRAAALEAHG